LALFWFYKTLAEWFELTDRGIQMSTYKSPIDLSVIIATWVRPQLLGLCLYQFAEQSIGDLRCEQIVVSDRPDDRADDNRYLPHALATLYAAAYGVDLGVVQVVHDDFNSPHPIPDPWTGTFEFGNIDTMCVCVRRELARTVPWAVPDEPERGEDHRWILRLQQAGATVHFIPIVIGEHISA
jgi:hypothetical protein